MPVSKKINVALHGARGLAALMVVFSHIGISGITDKFFVEIPTYLEVFKYILLSGQYGVEIFFMISGYLITASVIRHKTVASFLLDRCIRLYPVFVPALLFIFVLGPITGYAYFTGFTWFEWFIHFVINLLFIPGVVPIKAALVVAWSLSYEAVFYLAASYFKFFKSDKKAQLLFSILIVVPFIIILPRSVFFVIGVFVYYGVANQSKLLIRSSNLLFCYFVIFILFLFVLQFHEILGFELGLINQLLLWMGAVFFGYLVFVEVALESSSAMNFLKWHWMQFLGTISYSLYMWHTLVLFGTKRIFANSFEDYGSYSSFIMFSVVSLALSILISYVSYVILEVKVVAALSKIKKDIQNRGLM